MSLETEQLADFQSVFSRIDFSVIFDVGANVGQSSTSFRRVFRDAQIFAFEPVTATFERLRRRFAADDGVQCYNMALGEEHARARITANATKTTNRIVTDARPAAPSKPTIEIDVETGDRFSQAHGVSRINFLKIDTEGFDLKVLQGFSGMLSRSQVDLLQVEVSMHPDNDRHVPFEAFKQHLQSLNYYVFKIYDQSLHSKRPQLRRANVVFASDAQIGNNARVAEEAGLHSL